MKSFTDPQLRPSRVSWYLDGGKTRVRKSDVYDAIWSSLLIFSCYTIMGGKVGKGQTRNNEETESEIDKVNDLMEAGDSVGINRYRWRVGRGVII